MCSAQSERVTRTLSRYGDIVDRAYVRAQLYHTSTTRVRHNRYAKLRAQKQDGQDLVHACETAGVELATQKRTSPLPANAFVSATSCWVFSET